MDINILKEIGKIDKLYLTNFLDWYKKNYTMPLNSFVGLDFTMQVGVVLNYLIKEQSILVYCDDVGNIVVVKSITSTHSFIHEYKEGGLMSNYVMGIVRAFVKIKERKK